MMNKQEIDRLQKILFEAEKYSKEYGYYGYDPIIFTELPHNKKYIGNQSTTNKIKSYIERFLLFLKPNLNNYFEKQNSEKKINYYGLGVFMSAYTNLYKLTNSNKFREEAKSLAELSIENLIKLPNGLGVKNPKTGKTKSFFRTKVSDSTVYLVSGAENIFGLLNLYDITNDIKYLNTAQKIANSFIYDFKIKKYDNKIIIDYTNAKDNTHILNANALAGKAMAMISERSKTNIYDKFIKGIFYYIND